MIYKLNSTYDKTFILHNVILYTHKIKGSTLNNDMNPHSTINHII